MHCFLFIPFINIPILLSTKSFPEAKAQVFVTMLEVFITGAMTFPLYIINLSFLLETVESYEQISTYNIVSLSFSILLFIKTPITFFMECFAINNKDDRTGKNQIKAILSIALTFGPLVLLEIIHFFPFCFAYYVDQTLHWRDLIHVLLIFNVPKSIFIEQMWAKTFRAASPHGELFGNCAFILCVGVIILPIFIVVPLIP